MKKEKNYTIEFFRFMLAVNFLFLHIYYVYPVKMGADPLFVTPTDIILIFAGFSGYFLMGNFKKRQAANLEKHIEEKPGRMAWEYLKARFIGLWPLYLLAITLGIIATCVWRGIPFAGGVMWFINAIPEILGLHITGFGVGNGFLGFVGEKPVPALMAVGPLWFLSGIFVCGYLIYYLLAKHEEKFTSFWAPVIILLYWGSCCLNNVLPVWNDIYSLGSFSTFAGFIHTFTMMVAGALLWIPVNNLKDKVFSKGMKAIFAIAQFFCIALIMFKSWVSCDSPIGVLLNVGWPATFVYCLIFMFLTLLNQDIVTRCPIWANRIWAVPGKMALYIYALHYPIISIVMTAMGIVDAQTWTANVDRIIILLAITVVATLILSFLVMKLDEKIIQPWLKTKPWFAK